MKIISSIICIATAALIGTTAFAKDRSLITCVQKSFRPGAMSFAVLSRTGGKIILQKLAGNPKTRLEFDISDAKIRKGAGVFRLSVDRGRSGNVLIEKNRTETLVEIALFEPKAELINTHGRLTDFVCEVY